jgi:hydrogenase expression/formation protein HypE
MKIGKLSNEQLKQIVLKQINYKRDDVLLRSDVGEDCAGIAFGDEICLLTTDPITGSASEVGKLAVHISCNDIASNGAAPIALLLTILAPESTTEEELSQVMAQAHLEASKLNVEIIGGHTEITDAVNRIVVSSTAVGKQKKEDFITNKKIQMGDLILMTKFAGVEGTGIIAYEKEAILDQYLSEDELKTAKEFLNLISVVKEGVIAGKHNVTSMHDVTEGGVLGALWEICEGGGLGGIVTYENIPIHPVTEKICEFFNINPLRLISSGTMMITISPDDYNELKEDFEKNNLSLECIGVVTAKDIYLEKRGRLTYVTPPDKDELYKVVFQ